MSEAKWYVVGDDGEQGPMNGEDLKALARAGEIVAETRVRREDLRMGVPASQVAGLLPDEPPPSADTGDVPSEDTAAPPSADGHQRPSSEPVATLADRAIAHLPRRTARATRFCLWTYALLSVGAGLIVSGTPAGAVLESWLGALLPLLWMTMLPLVAVSLLSAPLFLAWVTMSYRLVPVFGGRRRHAWFVALWAWIVPVLNVVIPLRMMTDLRRTFGAPSAGLVAAWCLVGLAGGGVTAWTAVEAGVSGPRVDAIRLICAGSFFALSAMLVGDTTRAQRAAVETARRARMSAR